MRPPARRLLTLATLTLALSQPARAQTAPAPLPMPVVNDAQLTELAAQLVLAHSVPGIGIALIDTDGVRALGVAGVRRAGTSERLQPDDKFHIGSCAKAMTATALARLAERGLLKFDEPIPALFPAIHADPAWANLTLLDILHHRAGFPTGAAEMEQLPFMRIQPDETLARDKLAERLLTAAPANPGTFAYSNCGYALAGHLAELRTHKPWRQIMQEEVFTPLSITSAGFGPPGPDQPQGHHPNALPAGTGPLADNPPALAPAGTLHLSLRDWAKFAAVHLNGGPKNYIAPASLALLHTPAAHAPNTEDDPNYAAGWGVVQTRGHLTLTHAGSNTLWFCQILLFPNDGWGILVATNQGSPNAQEAVTDASKELVSLSK